MKYSELYDPIPNLQGYLDRIGYTKKPEVTLSCLNELIKCSCESVPYENLNAWLGFEVYDLGIKYLYEKIVTKHRGGMCTEINGLLQAALLEIGFECYSILSKICSSIDGYVPFNHKALLVILDNKRYLVDAGQGFPSLPQAIEINEDKPSEVNLEYENYILCHDHGDWFKLEKFSYGKEMPTILFDTRPADLEDFIAFTYFYTSRNQNYDRRWMDNLLVSNVSEKGSLRLVNYELEEYKDGKVEKILIPTREELFVVLKEKFGLEII